MHLTSAWIVTLGVGAAGAASLAAVAAAVRRKVSELQQAMRPLRVTDRPRRSRSI